MMRQFDAKFGPELIKGLPVTPAVYLFCDVDANVLYVGKAKNIRRRLSSYRNASRRKKHRKMRMLVRESASLEVRLQESELRALVVENQLIQSLKPRYNVEGAFAFLYPAIGLSREGGQTRLCLTTSLDAWSDHGFDWYGVFRSRLRTKAAFDALVELLSALGHLEKRANLGPIPKTPGSRVVQIRRLDVDLVEPLREFLAGRSTAALGRLAEALLEKPHARKEARTIQELLHVVAAFFETDLKPLRDVLDSAGTKHATLVHQEERDRMFIEYSSSIDPFVEVN